MGPAGTLALRGGRKTIRPVSDPEQRDCRRDDRGPAGRVAQDPERELVDDGAGVAEPELEGGLRAGLDGDDRAVSVTDAPRAGV
jgi:hypothetical protein